MYIVDMTLPDNVDVKSLLVCGANVGRLEFAALIGMDIISSGDWYRSVSGKEWGDRRNYDLMVDSSIGLKETADVICRYVSMIRHEVY